MRTVTLIGAADILADVTRTCLFSPDHSSMRERFGREMTSGKRPAVVRHDSMTESNYDVAFIDNDSLAEC